MPLFFCQEKISTSKKRGVILRFSILLLFSVFFASTVFAQTPRKLLVLGDSLTEGYGVARDASFPALLEKKIVAGGKSWTVINAGISGSTTASATSRLKWQFKQKPDLIILALGANDGLRGLPIADTKKNLSQAIELAQKEKVKIMIAGMLLPPNYGEQYRKDFQKMYEELATFYKLPKIGFLLEGVAGNSSLNQSDGIHPNEKGHEVIATTVYQSIKDQL